MKIDIKKVMGKIPQNEFEASEQMIKAQQEVLEALFIFQSTIENWEDKDCLDINKGKMIKYFNKFSK